MNDQQLRRHREFSYFLGLRWPDGAPEERPGPPRSIAARGLMQVMPRSFAQHQKPLTHGEDQDRRGGDVG